MKKAVIILLHAGYWILYLLLNICFIRLMSYKQGNGSVPLHSGNPLLQQLHILFLSPVSTFSILPGLLGFYSFYTVLFTEFLRRSLTDSIPSAYDPSGAL